MQKLILAVALTLTFTAGLVVARERRETEPEPQRPAAADGGISVWFSPHGGCTMAVIQEIEHARSTILVQAYSFTSAPIAKALADAFDRGVKVTVILDKSNWTEHYTAATFLLNHRIPTYIDPKHAIAHSKIMVIDDATIITGSFNFTSSAEHENAENLLVIRDRPRLVSAYDANFREHFGHSEPYTGPREHEGRERSDRRE